MAFTLTKKVDVESFIKASIHEESNPYPQHCQNVTNLETLPEDFGPR
jgi:hypothetical protein